MTSSPLGRVCRSLNEPWPGDLLRIVLKIWIESVGARPEMLDFGPTAPTSEDVL